MKTEKEKIEFFEKQLEINKQNKKDWGSDPETEAIIGTLEYVISNLKKWNQKEKENTEGTE